LEAEGLTFDVTNRRSYRSAKFGSWEKSQALDAQVTEAGASAGVVFRHDLMAKTPNTVASHALIGLAHETGDAAMQDRVVEALFSAYFTQGLDVGDPGVLADLAEGAGIERSRASAFLSEPATFDAVIDDEKLARGLGLDGVPSFVLGGKVWYVAADQDELGPLLIDRDGRQHHASPPHGGVPQTTVQALVDRARHEVHPKLAELVAATSDPFVQTIVDVVVPRTVFGRVCLLGDAAFVVRPHTAGATAKAARDATVLATALKRAGQNVDAGLRSFEDTQLEYGRDLVGYGVALGQRWASKHARKPQLY
jgi:hypothetical protein